MADGAALRCVLVAGIGNIFCADDGFGVEVVKRLEALPLPEGVRVVDFGIRGVHLAYDMLDARYDEVILVDALPLDAPPGTLAVVDPEIDAAGQDEVSWDGHAMHPVAVLELVRRLGGRLPHILVVGCQPARLDEEIGLSPEVAAAVEPAARLVLGLVTEENARVPGHSGADRRSAS